MQRIIDETFQQTRSKKGFSLGDGNSFDLIIMALVYVFIGEHIAMIDFLYCAQRRALLQSGDYMIITVDDEIYDPLHASSLTGRGEFLKNCM